MKFFGVLLLVLGLGGFIFFNGKRQGYETVEGQMKTMFSQKEKTAESSWEAARWASLGVAVIGVVLIVAPPAKTK